MIESKKKITFDVTASRLNSENSIAYCKNAKIHLDTNLNGNPEAFNPAELLLAALSACIIKGIERVIPILNFKLTKVEVKLHGIRQDVPPKLEAITYEILIDTNEPEHRLTLLHDNVKKYGTIYNTLFPGTNLSGTLSRSSKQ